jgi:predicted transcriptional regulator of viral defense system
VDAQLGTGWPAVAALAHRQHGVVAIEQLIELGIGRGAIEKAIRNRRLHRLHRGVYAVGHIPRTRGSRWMAAVLACGPSALLSHRNAAALWEIRDATTHRIDITIPPGSGRRRPGLVIHRHRLHPEDVARHRAIPVTSSARTLHDCTRELGDDEAGRMLREAFYRRRLKHHEDERDDAGRAK